MHTPYLQLLQGEATAEAGLHVVLDRLATHNGLQAASHGAGEDSLGLLRASCAHMHGSGGERRCMSGARLHYSAGPDLLCAPWTSALLLRQCWLRGRPISAWSSQLWNAGGARLALRYGVADAACAAMPWRPRAPHFTHPGASAACGLAG